MYLRKCVCMWDVRAPQLHDRLRFALESLEDNLKVRVLCLYVNVFVRVCITAQGMRVAAKSV